jgi:hypothetical protein
MEFVNETAVQAAWTMGFERDGREMVIVAIKATYTIPRDGAEPRLADEQVELVESDEFTGEPGLSAPRYESDYAHRKPMCDVLVNGAAYAPPGKVVRQTTVGLRVGPMVKTFTVCGHRVWKKGVIGLSVSDPEPFDVMPITYDAAFGGQQFLHNPVGRGHARSRDGLDGQPLPNTEETGTPVTDPAGAYRPMSLGAIGRNWQPRVAHTGTYDQAWLDNRAPFWPDDFSYAYFQAALPDQQIPYPVGGEEVVLVNLSPEGRLAFRLPSRPMPVWFITRRGDERKDATIDTVVIEPDLGRFTMTWRTQWSVKRDCFEIDQIVAGRSALHPTVPSATDKPRFRSIADFVEWKKGRGL